jgi:hypothetical protein
MNIKDKLKDGRSITDMAAIWKSGLTFRGFGKG